MNERLLSPGVRFRLGEARRELELDEDDVAHHRCQRID